MKRKEPSKTTYKELFALSGNFCAFPGCKQNIFEENHNLIGQICHIEAAKPDGERYNPNQTDNERAGFDNLILLCATHHLVTNDASIYTVEKLKAMKKKHEERFKDHQYLITPTELNQIISSLHERITHISKKLEEEIKSKNHYEMKVKISLLLFPNGAKMLGLTGMNTGDLPITLSHWGFGLPNGNYIPSQPVIFPGVANLPHKLLPGENVTVVMDNSWIATHLKQAGYPNTICLRGFFQDQIENKYEIMTKPFNFY
ncbi:MAG: hypothetical protein ABSE07_03535 [Methanoregula sp.]